MIVVDSAPLIYLSKTGNLELLKRLYGRVIVPNGVWEEVVGKAQGKPGASEIEKAHRDGWIRTERVTVPQTLRREGAEGADGEVITLGKNRELPVLTNDGLLVAIAKTHGVKTKWLTQALVEAVHDEAMSPKEARMLLRDLVRSGLRVRSEVLAEVVHLIEGSTPQMGSFAEYLTEQRRMRLQPVSPSKGWEGVSLNLDLTPWQTRLPYYAILRMCNWSRVGKAEIAVIPRESPAVSTNEEG